MDVTPARVQRPAELLLLGVVAAVAALHFPLIFRINIGWDEFRFLSDVYAYRRGELTSALQTFHVHLFLWLPHVGANEVDQVIVARGVYYLLLLGTCSFLYVIARRFVARAGALFAVLVFLSYAEVIGYGTTFRFDGLSVFILLGALALVVRSPGAPAAVFAAAVAAALALMITVKSVFYFPALALVLVIGKPGDRWQTGLKRGLQFLLVLTVVLVGLYTVHNAVLPSATVSDSVGRLQRMAPTGIRLFDPFPQAGYLLRSMIVNLWTWLFLGAGVISLLLRNRKGLPAREVLLPLSLLIPLGSLVIYRNSFPYFFVFLMPVASAVAAIAFHEVLRTPEKRAQLAATGMVLVIVMGFGVHYRDHWRDETSAQRQLINTIHLMFPEPVPYIDPSSMIASFPKLGFFMSHWGLEIYHRAGEPIFQDLLIKHQPPILLRNYPLRLEDSAGDSTATLLPADRKVLRDNYIHHWRTIYVAGKSVIVSDTVSTAVEILIGGPYTLAAEAAVIIDGKAHYPGDVVNLEQGVIHMQAFRGKTQAELRWGRDLYTPSDAPVAQPLFRGFYPCGHLLSACAR